MRNNSCATNYSECCDVHRGCVRFSAKPLGEMHYLLALLCQLF